MIEIGTWYYNSMYYSIKSFNRWTSKFWFFLQFPEFGFLKPSMQMAGAGDGSECQVEKMTATSTTSPGPSDLSTDTEPDKETRTHPDQTGVVLLWSNKTIEVQLRQFKFHSLTQDIKYSWESLYRKLAKFFFWIIVIKYDYCRQWHTESTWQKEEEAKAYCCYNEVQRNTAKAV